jgi:uncharacterized damage-inducible protein DinB
MKNYLTDLTRYNHWANEEITGFILKAGDARADLYQASSFPSIRKTLYHLWDAQVIWLGRLRGQSLNAWPSQSFKGSLNDAAGEIAFNSLEIVRFMGDFNENATEREITYHSIDGKAWHNSVSEIIMHLVNHSTYHRGQLITMLRNSGFEDVGSTDMIRWFRSVKAGTGF